MNPPETMQIQLEESRTVPYRIRRSAKARHLRLTVSPEKGLEVVLPNRYPKSDGEHIEAFILEKRRWILRHLDAIEKQKQARPPEGPWNGRRIDLRGEPVTVIVEPTWAPKGAILKVQNCLLATIPRAVAEEKREAAARRAVIAWLKEEARKDFQAAAGRFAGPMGVTFDKIAVRDQKTRWGSCSSAGTLSFNWRLVMAPPEALEYIVVHELAHLKEMNHSARFWRLVDLHCPERREREAWLKKSQRALSFL